MHTELIFSITILCWVLPATEYLKMFPTAYQNSEFLPYIVTPLPLFIRQLRLENRLQFFFCFHLRCKSSKSFCQCSYCKAPRKTMHPKFPLVYLLTAQLELRLDFKPLFPITLLLNYAIVFL